MMTINTPPKTVKDLMARADDIAGLSLAQLAAKLSVSVPQNQLRAKGWLGQLIEASLGADAGSLPQPDFRRLGIELKTIPLDARGKPAESTFVCSIPLLKIANTNWKNSTVYRKLRHVLWVPIEADPKIPMVERRIGSAILWQLKNGLEKQIKADWEELTEMIAVGALEQITARHGQYLQIRPKAANAMSLCWTSGPDGELVQTLPRGFYLRPIFSQQILNCV